MAKPQSAELKAQAKAKRAAAKAARDAAAMVAEADLWARRSAVLEEVVVAVGALAECWQEIRKRRRRRDDLANHLEGFYEEVDKLAKGKTLLAVTDLVLQEANQSIRDAKAIVAGDAYLERVKEFVPAGDNPVYPDVVIALRTVRQALDRATPRLKSLEETVEERLHEARTVQVALSLTIEATEPPTLITVKQRMTGNPDELDLSWFPTPFGRRSEEASFDVSKLDDIDSIDEYFAVEEDDE